MRKVKYPLHLDVSELVSTKPQPDTDPQLTDSVRDRVQPINAALKTTVQARDDRAKQIKQLRGRDSSPESAEAETRSTEKARFEDVVLSNGHADVGSNPSSMYELCGESMISSVITTSLTNVALVTHKGASADSGMSVMRQH
jgi:ubiquitin carboxyl-terminal hydrolase 14